MAGGPLDGKPPDGQPGGPPAPPSFDKLPIEMQVCAWVTLAFFILTTVYLIPAFVMVVRFQSKVHCHNLTIVKYMLSVPLIFSFTMVVSAFFPSTIFTNMFVRLLVQAQYMEGALHYIIAFFKIHSHSLHEQIEACGQRIASLPSECPKGPPCILVCLGFKITPGVPFLKKARLLVQIGKYSTVALALTVQYIRDDVKNFLTFLKIMDACVVPCVMTGLAGIEPVMQILTKVLFPERRFMVTMLVLSHRWLIILVGALQPMIFQMVKNGQYGHYQAPLVAIEMLVLAIMMKHAYIPKTNGEFRFPPEPPKFVMTEEEVQALSNKGGGHAVVEKTPTDPSSQNVAVVVGTPLPQEGNTMCAV